MKKLTLFFILFLSVVAIAKELPRIAVYVTGDVPENERSVLGTRMLASLIKSGHYIGIERSSSFLAEIEKEQIKQRSGAIDDSQISALGRQFGVKYVCIANITPAFGTYQVSARVVDVETAVVVHIGESHSPLKTMDDLTNVSDKIVEDMFDGQPKSVSAADGPLSADGVYKPKTEIRISAGGGGFYSNDFGGGIIWNRTDGEVTMPYSGGGVYLFLDVIYAQVFIAYSAGGGKWESPNATADDLHDMRRSYINFGIFAKYPLAAEPTGNINIEFFPLLGIDYEASLSGKLVRENGSEYSFDGGNGHPEAGDLSALWIKFGIGGDVGLSESIYLRAELMYGVRTANRFEKDAVDMSVEASTTKTKLGHGLTLRVGAGIKF